MKRILAIIFLYSSFSHGADVCRNIKTDAQTLLCMESKRDSADKYLNDQYSKLLDKIRNRTGTMWPESLKQENVKKLKIAQRNWIEFRDSNCKLYSLVVDDRTLAYQIAFSDCIITMSEARGKELNEFLHPPVYIY